MTEIPFALAFTAGLVATINPCGFAMLPAYLSYFMGIEADAREPGSAGLARGLAIGTVVSAGFLTVFGLAGVLITLGVQAVVQAVPWAAMVIGVGVSILGVAMVLGFELRAAIPQLARGGSGRQLRGVFLFGISYAIASLSCALPVFLVVVASAIPRLGLFSGVATFLVYGAGMSVLLIVVTLALSVGKQALVTRLRRTSPYLNRAAGVILIVAGAYIVLYWATTLAGGGTAQLGLVLWVEQLSSMATNWVSAHAVTLGSVAASIVVLAALAAWRRSTA